MNFFVYIFFNFLVYVGATPPWLRDDNDDDDNDDNKVVFNPFIPRSHL